MKIAGSYASLIQGISQQAPELRQAGQHTEQVNLLPDPVRGLARRKGTIAQAIASATTDNTLATQWAATFGGYRVLEHTSANKNYNILLRDTPSPNSSGNSLPPVLCYCIDDAAWVPVFWNSGDALAADTLNTNGISACVSIGQYMLFAAKNTPCSSSTEQVYGVTAFGAGTSFPGRWAVVWVRGGAYSRVYVATASCTYTDHVSGLPVTGLINFTCNTPTVQASTSSNDIDPAHIIVGMVTSQPYVGSAADYGSYMRLGVADNDIDINVSDGGDGSLIRGVKDTISDASLLPPQAVDGMVVKVVAGVNSTFYMRATGKNPGSTDIQEVTWIECAGISQGTDVQALGIGRVVQASEGTPGFYIGFKQTGNPTGLAHMPAVAEEIPEVVPSSAGDPDSSPLPRWLGNQITFMGMFQDRLLIASDAAMSVSAAGDYLNHFRSTVVTVPDSDAFEMVTQGGEDDSLISSASYDKNLVLFGKKRQYVINGSVALTGTSANMAIMTTYPNGQNCPVAAGGLVYYTRDREASVEVHQIQPGQYVDSAESFPASAQIGDYIPSPAAQLVSVPGAPAMLVLRSRSSSSTLYVFSYVDQVDGRKQAAWFKLVFNPLCGNLMGFSQTADGLILLWARVNFDGSLSYAADLLPLSASDSNQPYLDSMRQRSVSNIDVSTDTAEWQVAYNQSSTRFLIGAALSDSATLAQFDSAYPDDAAAQMVGLPYDSYVTLTNPYQLDQKGKAILTGRTVVTKVVAQTRNSCGMAWVVSTQNGDDSNSVNGRVLGDPSNKVGVVPITNAPASMPVGRETRAYSLTISANSWLPLNLISLEWVGQAFNRTPRA